MIYIRKKVLKWILIFIGIILLIFLFNIYRSYHWIQTESYQFYSEKISEPLRLVVIADQHDFMFGQDNNELITKIITQQPDAILMVGDMLNRESETTQKVEDLIKRLVLIAPVYFAIGNHELDWEKLHEEDLTKKLEDAGAVVLNRELVDVKLNNQRLRVGGLYDYAAYFYGIDMADESNEKVQVYNFLTEYQDTDAFKIMLSHRPDSFIFADASKNWDIDLVCSGHLHGGQVVLPFLGGVYGGDQGWFPEYVHGLYEKDKMNILITSGLSTNKKAVPRWNNPPEIVLLELLPENNME